ncbi:hypothetical protein BpHYR1_045344 [Brachionus plicatilis]|uniref:Uncharacterized protein n=1 Tax=Brachionus plicatilis TaxID=10195 RepID=A0A3M7SRQ8_BRAPC|nr:hypothetical protein BpHYR1_045344 [Brachionus plicatilis]
MGLLTLLCYNNLFKLIKPKKECGIQFKRNCNNFYFFGILSLLFTKIPKGNKESCKQYLIRLEKIFFLSRS